MNDDFRPIVSILMVTHNNAREVGVCLDSVVRHTHIDHEIVLVDNASDDATLAAVAGHPQVRMVANQGNPGFAMAVNQAARLARGRYLLLLNPDTVVHAGAVDRLAAYLQQNPAVGICAPRSLTADGRIRHNCFPFETPWSFFWFSVGIGPLQWVRDWILPPSTWKISAATPQVVEAATGAALLIRQDLFARLGGLDERFFMYSEDGDFCLRARRAGAATVLVPDAIVTHLGGASTPSNAYRLNGMIGHHLLRSRYSYTHKYWGTHASAALRMALAGAGAVFWVAGHWPMATNHQAQLRCLGRLLWTTPSGRAANPAHEFPTAMRRET